MELPFTALVGRQIGPQGAMAFPTSHERAAIAGRPPERHRPIIEHPDIGA
jgi:hypothetical protein